MGGQLSQLVLAEGDFGSSGKPCHLIHSEPTPRLRRFGGRCLSHFVPSAQKGGQLSQLVLLERNLGSKCRTCTLIETPCQGRWRRSATHFAWAKTSPSGNRTQSPQDDLPAVKTPPTPFGRSLEDFKGGLNGVLSRPLCGVSVAGTRETKSRAQLPQDRLEGVSTRPPGFRRATQATKGGLKGCLKVGKPQFGASETFGGFRNPRFHFAHP